MKSIYFTLSVSPHLCYESFLFYYNRIVVSFVQLFCLVNPIQGPVYSDQQDKMDPGLVSSCSEANTHIHTHLRTI